MRPGRAGRAGWLQGEELYFTIFLLLLRLGMITLYFNEISDYRTEQPWRGAKGT